MRTEVKIGVAIGLVVALVVVGYLVWQSHNGKPASPEAVGYNRTFGTPVVPAHKPPEVLASGGGPGGATTAPTTAPAVSVIPHFATPGAGLGTSGAGTPIAGGTGTGLRVLPQGGYMPGGHLSDSTTPAASSVSLERTYTIASGDTLSSIAQKEYGEASKYTLIVAANPGLDANHLKLNAKIKIPPAPAPAPAVSSIIDTLSPRSGSTTRPAGEATSVAGTTYVVQDGDSLWTIAKKVYGDATLCTAIEKSNHVSNTTVRKDQKLVCPPLDEARRLAGVPSGPTTRPSTILSAGTTGTSDTDTTSTRTGGSLAHAGTGTTAHAAAPADDGKPRFPVPD